MLSLRELSQLAEAEYSIESTRQDLNKLVDWFMARDDQELALTALGNERGFSSEELRRAKVFYVDYEMIVDEIPEEFRSEALGMVRREYVIYAGRFVYPVMDVKGNVMGFCGWDKFSDGVKYLDSKNHGYKAKRSCFYGMERMDEYYRSDKPLFVVEGIVCCVYLRSKGFNAIALLGSKLYPYIIEVLKRFGNRCIIVPDNDIIGKTAEEINENPKPAGEGFVNSAKRNLPEAVVIQSIIDKDIDDSRKHREVEDLFLSELRELPNPFYFYKTIRVR